MNKFGKSFIAAGLEFCDGNPTKNVEQSSNQTIASYCIYLRFPLGNTKERRKKCSEFRRLTLNRTLNGRRIE